MPRLFSFWADPFYAAGVTASLSSALPVDRVLLPSPSASFERCTDTAVAFSSTAPGVFCVRVEGHYDLEMARFQTEKASEAIADGPVKFFIDWEALTTYDSDARTLLTKWCLQHRAHLAEVHILTTFRIVAMGVAVANMALSGKLQAHQEWATFAAAFRDA